MRSILILFFDEREYSYAKSGLKDYGIMKDFERLSVLSGLSNFFGMASLFLIYFTINLFTI
jgi:hypothetical protein